MNYLPEERARELAIYIVKTSCTVRQAGSFFGISKSTVHSDITERLSETDPELYRKVRAVLDKNKSERHIRGGKATKEKFILMKSGKKEDGKK